MAIFSLALAYLPCSSGRTARMTKVEKAWIRAKMLEHLRAVSGAELRIVAVEYDLGSNRMWDDDVIFGDETIGVVMKGAVDTLENLSAD